MDGAIKTDRVVHYLKSYVDTLPDTYSWDISVDRLVPLGVLTTKELLATRSMSPYEKGIYVKETVPPALRRLQKGDPKDFYDLCYWVIADWGGIRGLKRDNVPALVDAFLNSDRPSFDRIPSASKVGSYLFPDRFVAYDSRLVYALNWALLATGTTDVFFPIPPGRNAKLAAFPMDVLIRLVNRERYVPTNLEALETRQYTRGRDQKLFVPNEDAYNSLIELIADLNKQLFPGEDERKLYLTEMLLFSIADKEVFRDITTSFSVTIAMDW